MAPHGGDRDYMPHTDPRAHVDPDAAWTKVDLFLIVLLIVVPILGMVFGL